MEILVFLILSYILLSISLMPLFERAGGDVAPFAQVLDDFYDGVRCPLTEAILCR